MGKQFYFDLAERSLWTFVQAAAAVWLVTQSLDREALYVALVAGLVAVAKGLIAAQFGNGSASTLPQSLEPKPPQFGARR